MQIKKFVTGPFEVNSFLIIDENSNEAIVVDPGHTPIELIDYVDLHQLNLRYLINTHGHVDHIGGNSDIVDKYKIPIFIGELDSNMLVNPSSNLSTFLDKQVISPPADKYLADGDSIELGEVSIDVLETPGHTPGSISLIFEGNAICGDVLFLQSIGRTDFPQSDFDTLINSIKNKLFKLPDSTIVYAGHGPETTIGHEKEMNPFLR